MGGALGAAVPDFGAGDHPFLAVPRRAGAQVGQVGSRLGLGIAHGADHFAPGDQRQPFGFVLLGAVPHDHRRHRRDRQVGAGHAPVFELAHQQVLMDGAEPKTAVFARPVQPEPALLADLATKPGHLPAGELQIMLGKFGPQCGGDVVVEEFANLGQPRALLGVEFEIHAGPFAADVHLSCLNSVAYLSHPPYTPHRSAAQGVRLRQLAAKRRQTVTLGWLTSPASSLSQVTDEPGAWPGASSPSPCRGDQRSRQRVSLRGRTATGVRQRHREHSGTPRGVSRAASGATCNRFVDLVPHRDQRRPS